MSEKPWDEKMISLIERFERAKIPKRPFEIRPGVTIEDPKLWRTSILADIGEGTSGPRSRTGALKKDLKDFFQVKDR